MPKQSGSNDNSANPHERGTKGEREVGRILLGERVFSVALASELPDQHGREETCYFELANMSLVVFETTDQRRPNAHEAADDLVGRLTGRELEIAVLVAQGYATKNIAYRLQLSEWTVATYLRRIFAKLDVGSRAAMVYRCAPLIDRAADLCCSARQVGLPSSPCTK
jgi:DNA-binding NarL/FixJ family response regulator